MSDFDWVEQFPKRPQPLEVGARTREWYQTREPAAVRGQDLLNGVRE